MEEKNPILKKITENKLRLKKMQKGFKAASYDAGDPILAELKNLNYNKYLKMSVKALRALPKPIKKKLQTDDDFLVEYAKKNTLSRAMLFACRDKLNEKSLIIRFINLEPATAINKAGSEIRKNAEIVALAFQVANRRNVKSPKVPTELQENVEFLTALIQENPEYIHLLTPRQKKDERLMLTMLKTAPEAKEIKEVISSTQNEESLAKNSEFMLSAIEVSPSLVGTIDPNNKELIEEAIKQTPEAEKHLNSEQKEALTENYSQDTEEELKIENQKFEIKKDLDAEEALKKAPEKKKTPLEKITDELVRQL